MDTTLAVAGQFLPDNYEEPKTSRYMRLEEGPNEFRVLGSAIFGREYWKTKEDGGRVPIRVHFEVKIPIDELEENPQTGELDMPKVFWSFPVWNYGDKCVQILHLTQKTIRQAMQAYVRNPKWGDPKTYDFIVTRMKEGGKTSYAVLANPKSPTPPEALEEFAHMTINLEALFEAKDPFVQRAEVVDPGDQIADDVEQGLAEEAKQPVEEPKVQPTLGYRRGYGRK